MKSTRYKRHKPPHGNEEKQQKTFFSKANDTAVQTKAEQPFFQPAISPFGGGAGGGIQTKLTVGQPGDKYEKEADNVADAVVNNSGGAAPAIQQKEISNIQRSTLASPEKDEKFSTAEQRMEEDKMIQEKSEEEEIPVQKMEEEEEPEVMKMDEKEEMPVQKMEEEEPIQQKEEEEPEVMKMEKEEEPAVQTKAVGSQNTASSQVSQKINQKSGRGRPLAGKTRAEMESGIGADFSDVNIHTDRDAQDMNKELHAQAFTHGKDVYFNSGKYNPETTEGKRLLAHELTHVVQQNGTRRQAHEKEGHLQRKEGSGQLGNILQRLPGDGMAPPGDCNWAKYGGLRGAVEAAKLLVSSLGTCSVGDSCPLLATKIAAIAAEIGARVALDYTCFRGGNEGHRQQVQGKVNMLKRCYSHFGNSNCPQRLVEAMNAVVERALEVMRAVAAGVLVAALIVALIVAIIALVEAITALAAAAAVGAAATAIVAVLVLIIQEISPEHSTAQPEA